MLLIITMASLLHFCLHIVDNMATVNKVIGHLTCSVCYKLYENPKFLSCHHSFCKKCLEMMQPQSVIVCPICRRETTLSAGGVKELDDNFSIASLIDDLLKSKMDGKKDTKCDRCQKEEPVVAYCVDCVLFLCDSCDKHQHHQSTSCSISCDHRIIPLTETRINDTPKYELMTCSIHDTELLFYCESCEQLICVCCQITDHDGHLSYPIEEVAEKHRDELREAAVSIEKLSRNISKAFNTIDKMGKRVQEEGNKANKYIDDHYNNLIAKLEEEKQRLKQEVQDSISERKKLITTKLEKVEHVKAEVKSIKEMNDSLIRSHDQKLLSGKCQVIDRMHSVTSKYEKLDTNITLQANLKFVPNLAFPQFGWLCSTAVPVPYKCETIDLPADVYRNHTTKFTMITRDINGHCCYKEDIQVKVLLDGENLHVSDNKNGRYTISFVALEVGETKLSVFVDGKHIIGSPFKITVNYPYTAINKPLKMVNNYGGLGRPWGISFSRDGIWAVTDYSNSFVYIYDNKDELVKMIGSPGEKEDQFECPFGVAFDNNNNLYVVDGGNSRIQKFNLLGNFLCQFGGEKLRNARGITVHDSKVYVTDKANRCITVFNTDGQYCYTIKSKHLRTPCDVTVGVNNQLYVSDSDNRCIHTFALDGNYICKLGTSETSWGQLRKPWGLNTDTRGNLLVTDVDSHRISIFNKDGILVHCFGTNGKEDGEFNTPFGIGVSPKGNLYVCDYENKRIQIF